MFTYLTLIPKINIINCKTERLTITYCITPVMASKSTIIGNISVFKELNIN